jgi:membrane-bound lytic murein transglycosylase B
VAALAAVLVACATPTHDAEAAKKRTAHPAARPTAPVRSDDAPEPFTYGRRDDVLRYAAEAAAAQGLDPAWVEAQLAQARFQPTVTRLMMPPPAGTAKNWLAYRARFVEPKRIDAGVQFWNANADTLRRAEAQYGVPASVIVGIVGVETFYGRITGGFRVLDALATLAFDFPSGRKDRTPFFRDELAQFLAFCAREQLPDCGSVKGSYAGAMGLPQFMPSSIAQYAVDYDGDGHIDLMNSAADVIGSVAHYLARFGWEPGMPTHYAVAPPVDTRERALLLAPDIVPSFSAAEFAAHGALLDEAGRRHAGPLALVELQNGDAAPSYVAGTQNFYVVTRYNWSSYYALGVIELGNAVERARGGAVPAQ